MEDRGLLGHLLPCHNASCEETPAMLATSRDAQSEAIEVESRGRGRVALPARRAGSWEAPPRPGSKSGGRRARMWRVTLNCSRSQTPGLPARPPALPERSASPPRPTPATPPRPNQPVPRSSLTAGHPAPDAGPIAVPASPRSLYLSCRRRGTAALPRGRAAGRTLQPGSATPPPRLLPFPPFPPRRPSRHYLDAALSGRRAALSSLP